MPRLTKVVVREPRKVTKPYAHLPTAHVALPASYAATDTTGRFVFVVYDRITESYTLHLDDDSLSSYPITDPHTYINVFKSWGIGELVLRTFGAAREWGAAQGVRSTESVIHIEPEDVPQQTSIFSMIGRFFNVPR